MAFSTRLLCLFLAAIHINLAAADLLNDDGNGGSTGGSGGQDGYGDTPPPPPTNPFFTPLVMPTFSFPFITFPSGIPTTTPAWSDTATSLTATDTIAVIASGIAVLPNDTPSAPGLPGYTFTPSFSFPPDPSSILIQTTAKNDGITGPSLPATSTLLESKPILPIPTTLNPIPIPNPTPGNIPPLTSCANPDEVISIHTQTSLSTLTTHISSLSYRTVVQTVPVVHTSLIVTPVAVLVTEVGCAERTTLVTNTRTVLGGATGGVGESTTSTALGAVTTLPKSTVTAPTDGWYGSLPGSGSTTSSALGGFTTLQKSTVTVLGGYGTPPWESGSTTNSNLGEFTTLPKSTVTVPSGGGYGNLPGTGGSTTNSALGAFTTLPGGGVEASGYSYGTPPPLPASKATRPVKPSEGYRRRG